MKFQRPGYTEGSLLILDFIKDFQDVKNLNKLFKTYINWLYTTSGFYDRNIAGCYFDFNHEVILESENFNNFINLYKNSLFDCSKLNLLYHKNFSELDVKNFIESLKPLDQGEFWFNYKKWYRILDQKKVLLINSFSPIMFDQYDSGNLHKIDPDFPILADLKYFRTPYTFFNNGPEDNYFETLNNIISSVSKVDFDIALVASGAYACPIVDAISKDKLAVSMGHSLHLMFGINPGVKRDHWVSEIPQQYIPKNYLKIEDGRYWIGKN